MVRRRHGARPAIKAGTVGWHAATSDRPEFDPPSSQIHPSAAAVDYLTTRLIESHFSRADDALRSECSAVRAAARHRHARPASAAARAFAETQLARCRQLAAAHPHLDGALADEVDLFGRMLRVPGVGSSS